jgi:DNA-binding CsgD family transcriptional regulator
MTGTIRSRVSGVEPGDDIEQALLSARALVDTAISNHRKRSSVRPVVELPPDESMMGATVRRLVALTRTELICVLSPARYRPDVARNALADVGLLVGRGIAVRMLFTPDIMHSSEGVEFIAEALAHGIQARISESPLPDLLMADDRVALVRPDGAGSPAAVAYVPSILHALRALFAGTWQLARPATDIARQAAGGRLTQEVLECLCAGHKDDAAARKLGLSVRTYRRHVADLLRDMGVASRFQAGVRAVELRLLPGQAEVPAQLNPPSTWNTAPVT